MDHLQCKDSLELVEQATGGTIRHLEIPFGEKENYSALEPDLNNFEYEGTLSSMKRWAFVETDILCHSRITVPDKDGNIFKGDECPKTGNTSSIKALENEGFQ